MISRSEITESAQFVCCEINKFVDLKKKDQKWFDDKVMLINILMQERNFLAYLLQVLERANLKRLPAMNLILHLELSWQTFRKIIDIDGNQGSWKWFVTAILNGKPEYYEIEKEMFQYQQDIYDFMSFVRHPDKDGAARKKYEEWIMTASFPSIETSRLSNFSVWSESIFQDFLSPFYGDVWCGDENDEWCGDENREDIKKRYEAADRRRLSKLEIISSK